MKTRLIARLLAGACFLLALANATAEVALAPLFRDNAVLQRDKPVPVWGRAKPGEKVTVSHRAQTASAVADSQGCWSVALAAMPASADPATMTVTGENTLTVRNVLVGEVWLCSGQSNMAFTLAKAGDDAAKAEIAAADHPLIRLFNVPLVTAAEPAAECGGAWEPCSPKTAGGFSAVAYFFGRELHRKLGVPIGLVNSSWGGTPVESWMSKQAIAADPAGKEVMGRWKQGMERYPALKASYDKALAEWNAAPREAGIAKREGKKAPARRPAAPAGPDSHKAPSSLYNAMISPLVPYALRGAIWYQGEANAARHTEYRTLFPSMIKQWREDFKQGDIPFYYVQLAAFNTGSPWAFQREAQQCALKLPATGEAVAIDIGEEKNIHPKNKLDVGRRLALNALALAHGMKVEYSGPGYAGVAVEGGKLRVTFTHAAGLSAKTPALPGFIIAGADKQFTPARAAIEGETVVVYSDSVKNPVAVRYAWASWPEATLYNAAGLPASPFRSDNWAQ